MTFDQLKVDQIFTVKSAEGLEFKKIQRKSVDGYIRTAEVLVTHHELLPVGMLLHINDDTEVTIKE